MGVLAPAGTLDLRAISRVALITALALVLPPIFHALRLGHVFLPMYLPILAGAFFLRPRAAAAAGLAAPLVSAAVTGMPPLFPPIALWMALELACTAALLSVLDRRRWAPWLSLVVALALGRGVYAGLVFVTARWLALPAGLLTLAALLAAWPGLLLALAAVPATVRLLRREELRP